MKVFKVFVLAIPFLKHVNVLILGKSLQNLKFFKIKIT